MPLDDTHDDMPGLCVETLDDTQVFHCTLDCECFDDTSHATLSLGGVKPMREPKAKITTHAATPLIPARCRGKGLTIPT